MKNFNPIAAELASILLSFDDKSTANIYHLQLLFPDGQSSKALCDFHRSVRNLCSIDLVSECGDCAARMLILSHVSPACFENLLNRNFIKFRSSSLFNIIF